MGEINTRPTYIYVDVDDTLIRSVGSKRIPNSSVIAHIKALAERGAVLYCWSTGGADYACRSAEECGIADRFVAFLPKPNILLDDQEVANWRCCRTVHPANYAAIKLTDVGGGPAAESERGD
jgi:hypothetical protein